MLCELMKVGEMVIVNIPDENWEWGYRPVKQQKGTKAKITGFDEIAYSYVQNYGREPGIYTNYSWVYLEGIKGSVSSCFLEPDDVAEYKKRLKDFHAGKCHDEKPLRPLPKMKFWEGDIVSIDWHGKPCWENDKEFSVIARRYENLEAKRNDGSPMPEYTIGPARGNGGTTWVNESDMTLIRRGNVWKHFNGEKLVFSDLREEANFFTMLGHTEEVRNPACNLYKWEKDEILAAVRNGTVDGFTMGGGLFGGMLGGEPQIRAQRFRDRELGERVRQETIKGFADEPKA